MKTILLAILPALAFVALTITSSPTAEEVSWRSFCEAHGYDPADNSDFVMNQYLDTWRGSVDEDSAFAAAGVKPF